MKSKKRRWLALAKLAARRIARPIAIACFVNPLILTDDGRDDYLCAEHYYMFGNFAKDPDRFPDVCANSRSDFLRELGYGEAIDDEHLEQGHQRARKRCRRLSGHRQRRRSDCRKIASTKQTASDVWTRMLQREDVLVPRRRFATRLFRCSPNMLRA